MFHATCIIVKIMITAFSKSLSMFNLSYYITTYTISNYTEILAYYNVFRR